MQKELEILTKHLKASDLSYDNKKRLLAELESAEVVKEEQMPEDVVCLDSEVEIQDTESGKKFTFQIVMPAEANIQRKCVSIFAPMAIAILGYRIGSRVQWEMPAGLKTVEILRVRQKDKNLAL